MSFQLSQTPTLEAVSTDDEQILSQDMQARVAEAVTQAQALPEIAAAMELARATAEELGRLRTAERALHQMAKDSRRELDRIGRQAIDALVDAAAGGAKPEWQKTDEAAAIENKLRYAGRALERLAEHSIPLAQIASLREEAHSLEAQARALESIAEERAKKVLEQIRGAVSDEMVLPVDFSKGVAGALLARAKQWRYRAVQLAGEADGLEQSYRDRDMTQEQELDLLNEELLRQEPVAIRMEDIRPAMTEQERSRTLEQILRVLRGQDRGEA